MSEKKEEEKSVLSNKLGKLKSKMKKSKSKMKVNVESYINYAFHVFSSEVFKNFTLLFFQLKLNSLLNRFVNHHKKFALWMIN